MVDVETGKISFNQDVLITGNSITHIQDHGARIHADIIIKGTNKFLIPGLWDMHLHTMRKEWYRSQFPLLRANGITGFREMWGDLTIANYVRSQIQADSLPYFRFVASGHILDGPRPFWGGSIAVDSPCNAGRIVDSLLGGKPDFIKVYSFLTPETFQAIANRCRERKVQFVGHVPHTMWITDASNAGMESMEHLYGFLTEACAYPDSARGLMQQSVAAFEAGNTNERKRVGRLYHDLVLKHFSPARLKGIAKILKKNNTHIVPTLVMLRGSYFINDTSFTNDPRKTHMSKETLDYWNETTEDDLINNTATDWENKRKRWAIERQIMRILIEEKVPLMAGTDSDNPYAFPGFSLHDELALFVELGMSPTDALRSATLIPAEFLRMADSVGSIKEGKSADMVLLDHNPLENIANTKSISSVIVNGKGVGGRLISR